MTRIFDHLNGEPEDKRFSRIAHAMHGERWWSDVPFVAGTQAPEAGEVDDAVLMRITGPDFCASLIVGGRSAPIVGYMRGWTAERIRKHCSARGFLCEVPR